MAEVISRELPSLNLPEIENYLTSRYITIDLESTPTATTTSSNKLATFPVWIKIVLGLTICSLVAILVAVLTVYFTIGNRYTDNDSLISNVQLAGAVAVPGWGGQYSIDDNYLTLNLPVNLTLYNISSSAVLVVCLGMCSSAYSNGNLPTSSFGGPTAFGFWDDLMIYSGTSQTVYYNVDGIAPNRTTIFEFYESHYGQSTEYYHFQIIFYENLPNIVQYKYFEISDGGNSILPNTTLIFDTNTGTYSG